MKRLVVPVGKDEAKDLGHARRLAPLHHPFKKNRRLELFGPLAGFQVITSRPDWVTTEASIRPFERPARKTG